MASQFHKEHPDCRKCEVTRCQYGYLSTVSCKWLADGARQRHQLLLHSSPEWFTFLVVAYPSRPDKRWLHDCLCTYSQSLLKSTYNLLNYPAKKLTNKQMNTCQTISMTTCDGYLQHYYSILILFVLCWHTQSIMEITINQNKSLKGHMTMAGYKETSIINWYHY